MTTRVTIYASYRASEVMAELVRLEDAFLRTYKRRLLSQLFFASWGGSDKGEIPVYGLTVYAEPAQLDEVAWLQLTVSPSNAPLIP